MVKSASSAAVRDLVANIRPVLEADDRVLFAYLFGSRATAAPRPDSDVDVAVCLKDATSIIDEAKLQDRIAEVAGSDSDLVVLDRAPLWLAFRIVGDGVVVFSRDERARIAHRARVEQDFLDFRPYHNAYLYLAAVRRRARDGALSRG